MTIYADSGINWEFLYKVEYEDDCILVLRDMGRYHKFEDERKFKGKIDKYIDIRGEYAFVYDGSWAGHKLVEIHNERK